MVIDAYGVKKAAGVHLGYSDELTLNVGVSQLAQHANKSSYDALGITSESRINKNAWTVIFSRTPLLHCESAPSSYIPECASSGLNTGGFDSVTRADDGSIKTATFDTAVADSQYTVTVRFHECLPASKLNPNTRLITSAGNLNDFAVMNGILADRLNPEYIEDPSSLDKDIIASYSKST